MITIQCKKALTHTLVNFVLIRFIDFVCNMFFFCLLFLDALLADLQNSVPGNSNTLPHANSHHHSSAAPGYGSLNTGRPKQSPQSVSYILFIFVLCIFVIKQLNCISYECFKDPRISQSQKNMTKICLTNDDLLNSKALTLFLYSKHIMRCVECMFLLNWLISKFSFIFIISII